MERGQKEGGGVMVLCLVSVICPFLEKAGCFLWSVLLYVREFYTNCVQFWNCLPVLSRLLFFHLHFSASFESMLAWHGKWCS